MRSFPLMLFAAGFGTRMGALTANRPKPLVEVAGKPLIDHALQIAESAGISKKVVNLHYLGDQIAAHLAKQDVAFSWETGNILDTGGGLKAALPLLGNGPVLTLNTDAAWSGENPLQELAARWEEQEMDALLLLLPSRFARGHSGAGDFLLAPDGRISRANGAEGQIYLGAQIIRSEVVSAFSEQAFGMNRVWDALIERGRAFGILHQGGWCDVGSPAGITIAEDMLANV